jgi:hypothetical protein
MATAEQYADWIVKNKDKKGTPEFQKVANAYNIAKIQNQKIPSPTEGMSNTELALAGIGKGFVDVGRGIGQRLGMVSKEDVARARELDKPLMETTSGTVGNVIGNVASFLPAAFVPGANTVVGGAAIGGLTGLLTPTVKDESVISNIGTGATLGAVGSKVPDALSYLTGRGSKRLMQSAIKPQVKYLESGTSVPDAIETMLEYGVNPTQGRTIFGKGLNVLEDKMSALNVQIDDLVRNASTTVNKRKVLQEIENLRPSMIEAGADATDLDNLTKFILSKQDNPLLATADISVPAAQQMKKGVYKKLGESAYLKDATSQNIAAEKALGRGLRKQIAEAVPEVVPLNAEEAKLMNALNVSERKALNEANKDIMGLGNITPSLERTLMFMADRNAAFKSLLARVLYQGNKGVSALPTSSRSLLSIGVPQTSIGILNEE